MPRFGTKMLLIAVAVVAIWLSTFAGYKGASDIRAAIMFVVTFAAGFAAVYNRGSRRAFWAGFVSALLVLAAFPHNGRFVPGLGWGIDIARQWATSVPVGPLAPDVRTDTPGMLYGRQGQLYEAIFATLWAMSVLSLATVVGVVGVMIYRQSGRPADHD
jgi:hypothetical protein